MFIELTDQLRCPADHPESFLVLIPDEMEGRRVVRGTLGCPVCRAEYRIEAGIADLGVSETPQGAPSRPDRADALPRGAPSPTGAAESSSRPDAGALLAFLALEGPGGYVGLVGEAGRDATGLAQLLPGVHFALVNPPAGILAPAAGSVLRARRLPFKTRSLRGIVLGQPESENPIWQADAVRAVLPGLRAVGEGARPLLEGFEILGAAEGWWVGRAT